MLYGHDLHNIYLILRSPRRSNVLFRLRLRIYHHPDHRCFHHSPCRSPFPSHYHQISLPKWQHFYRCPWLSFDSAATILHWPQPLFLLNNALAWLGGGGGGTLTMRRLMNSSIEGDRSEIPLSIFGWGPISSAGRKTIRLQRCHLYPLVRNNDHKYVPFGARGMDRDKQDEKRNRGCEYEWTNSS